MNHPDILSHFSGTLEVNKSKLVTGTRPVSHFLWVNNLTDTAINLVLGDIQKVGSASGVANYVSDVYLDTQVAAGAKDRIDLTGLGQVFSVVGVFIPSGSNYAAGHPIIISGA